jgi:hypothetical protein
MPALVAAYGFDEGAGTTTADAAGNGLTGTLSGASWMTTGRYGKALSFNGTSSLVTVADATALHLSAAMTLEAWVRPTTPTTGYRTVLLKEIPGELAYALYAYDSDHSGRPSGWFRKSGGSTSTFVSGTSAPATGAWTHLAVTFDGATLRLFGNGTQVASTTASGPITNSTSPLRIGGNSVWGEYFSGLIDEVRVYNTALTAAQITADMNTPVTNPDSTPPTVSVGAPANNALLRGSTAVSANAADNVGVVGVQFKLDGANLGAEDTTFPYALTWNTMGAGNGTHTLTAVARDAAGNTAAATSVTVAVDNAAPTVSLTAPAAGAAVRRLVGVTASAADNLTVAGVQFLLDGSPLGAEDTTAPYSLAWDTAVVGNGPHTLGAVARDTAGNTTSAATVRVTVDNAPPTVSLTAPTGEGAIRQSIAVTAGAADNAGVVGVQFLLDGSPLGAEDTTAPYAVLWDTATSPDGPHTLSAAARDAAGNTTTAAAVGVTVDNAPPAVTVTAPTAGAAVSGSIAVTADAADNVAVAGVQFRLDGVNLGGELTTAPFEVAWDTTTAANGDHQLTAVARDPAGNMVTSGPVSVTVSNRDEVPPTVSLTAPAAGASLRQSVTLSAEVADNVGVARVQFLVDGDPVGPELTAAPYAVSWDTTAVADGAHALGVIARDAAGNTATAAPISVTVDNAPPSVTVTGPAEGETVLGLVAVTADAADNVAVAGVQFRLDGINLGSAVAAAPFTLDWDSTAVANGSHTLTAVAHDAVGNVSTSAVVSVTVNNPDTTPPTVALTTPANGAPARGTIPLAADAADNVGVEGVRFLLDGEPVGGEVTIAPYSITWESAAVPDGVHTLSAIARDAAGNSTTAAAVAVTVDNAPPTASVIAPAAGSAIRGSVAVIVVAADNVGVAGVQFLLDGNPLGAEDTTAPYSVSWNTAAAGNGAHTLSAVARDAGGNTASAADVTVTIDNVAPTVTVTAPANNSLVRGSILVAADAADNVAVAGVQFLLDGASLGSEVTTAPYSVTWDSTAVASGSHTLTAVARDTAGNSATAAVGVTVDNAPPVVTMVAPTNGATVTGPTVVSAAASDNRGVVGVQFLLDGDPVGAEDVAAPYSITWNAGTAALGTHRLAAVARDAAGNSTTASAISVTVSDQDVTPPTVSVTSPTGGTVGASLSVSAAAADNVAVAGVQFLLDGSPLGAEDTTAPYAAAWNSATATNGTHTLSARARDAAGNTTTSAAVTITVSNANLVPLTVNGGQTFQTIDGLGVNVNSHSWNNGEAIPALDLLHDQLGATLYRVVYDMTDWEATNDNIDPLTPDWTYYNALYSNGSFQELWGTLHYLNQKGVTGGITLSFMGRVPTWMGGSLINTTAEDEFVEMVSTLVYYARNTEHIQFSILDPINEPDWDGIEGPQVGAAQYTRLLHKLSDRLDAMGLSDIRFCGPNTAIIGAGVSTYMPALMGDPVVINKIDHFGLHDYSGSTGGADSAIRQSAYPTKNFWMTEVTNPVHVLSQLGQNASGIAIWDGFDSAYIHPTLHGASMVPPNDASPDPAPLAYDIGTGTYSPRPSFYQDQAIFKFVPPGSTRIGATQSNGNLTLYAYYQRATGRVTLVGRNSGGTTLTVNGALNNLPPARAFEFYKTDAGTNFGRLPDVPVSNGTLAFVAPANGYFTLTTITVPDNIPPTVAVTAPASGATVSGTAPVTANAADNVGIAGVQFLVDGANLGAEDTTAPYSVSWNTAAAANGPHQLTAVARDASGNTTTALAVSVTVNNVPDTTPPTVSVTGPAGGATVSGSIAVTADAADNVGVVGVQFLLDGASLGAEDTTTPYSVTWGTAAAANGTHALTARARDAAGNTTTSPPVAITVSNTTTTGLVAAYGFEEGTGTTAGDSTASALNGIVSGATWVPGGRYGKALSFNGTSNWVTVADAAALHLTTGMTVEAWVNPAVASTDWAAAVIKERTGGLAYALYATDGANKPPAGYINAGGIDRNATGTATLPLNTWSHLAVTYNGSTLRLYVNGAQVASKSQTGTIASSTGPLRFGGDSVWGEYFSGLIDEVRVYSTALTQAQIQIDMNTPVGGGGGAQLADRPAATPGPGTPAVSEEQLPTLLAAAVARWNAAGVPAALSPEPTAIGVRIADLPGSGLGFTNVATREIWIDRNAAGFGWSTAAVPVELPVLGAPAPVERFDLETVLAHEVGHLLGIADLTPSLDRPADLMDQTLAPGEVRLPSALDVRLAARATGFNSPEAPSDSIASVTPPASLDGIAVPLPGTFGWDGTVTGASSWALFDQWPLQWEERPIALPTSPDLAPRSIDPNGGVPLTVVVVATGDEVRSAPSKLADDMSPRPPSP